MTCYNSATAASKITAWLLCSSCVAQRSGVDAVAFCSSAVYSHPHLHLGAAHSHPDSRSGAGRLCDYWRHADCVTCVYAGPTSAA